MSQSLPPPSGTNVLPFHALATQGGERIERKPGRPRKVRIAPTAVEAEYQHATRKLREAALASDPILAARSSADVIQSVVEQLAREAASIGWERQRAEDRGLDSAAQLSSRRVDALGKIANLVVAAHKLGVFGNDPSPTKMAVVLKHWIATISEVTYETLPTEVAAEFMGRYVEAIGGVDLAAIMSE